MWPRAAVDRGPDPYAGDAAQGQTDSQSFDDQLTVASRSIFDGHVKAGLQQLNDLFHAIDPAKDPSAYWRAGSAIIENVSQIENYALAAEPLNLLLASKIPETNAALTQWMQSYLGRYLAFTGNADEAKKFLQALTGGEARLVFTPPQRAAAIILSTIELDRGNIGQAAIWIRRAVIGILADKAAGSEEIIDVLTEYASFLLRTHRFLEAAHLLVKLKPLFDAHFSPHSSKSLQFKSRLLNAFASVAIFPAAELALKDLKGQIAGVDVVADSVRGEVSYQELYQLARETKAGGTAQVIDHLKQFISDYPGYFNSPVNRITLSYLALISGDVDFADNFISAIPLGSPNPLVSAYLPWLKSLIAARRNNFVESMALAQQGLNKIQAYHQMFENETSIQLPTIRSSERIVLGLVLALNVPHAATRDQANLLFKLAQYLNRDKGKLGISERVTRERVTSDLQREDIRTRDRVRDLRDRLMEQATGSLLSRALPFRNYTPGQKNDYALPIRLLPTPTTCRVLPRARPSCRRSCTADMPGVWLDTR